MEEKSNVIMFPGVTRNRPPQSLEEVVKNVVLAKNSRIEGVVETVIINLFEELFDHGFDFTERHDANKDMAFLIEALKAMLNRHDGMSHPFHELAEQFFSADVNGDLTLLSKDVAAEISGDETSG